MRLTWILIQKCRNRDADGIRPDRIVIHLLRSTRGTEGTRTVRTITVTGEDGWKWRFEDLPAADENGAPYIYSVSEEAVDGYRPRVDGYNIFNTHVPETVTISGEKRWEDSDSTGKEDADGIRPEMVRIILMADGKAVASREVREGTDGRWVYEFADVPKKAPAGILSIPSPKKRWTDTGQHTGAMM